MRCHYITVDVFELEAEIEDRVVSADEFVFDVKIDYRLLEWVAGYQMVLWWLHHVPNVTAVAMFPSKQHYRYVEL